MLIEALPTQNRLNVSSSFVRWNMTGPLVRGFSQNLLQWFFWFFAWSSGSINTKNWRSPIFVKKSHFCKNGWNVVKNEVFRTLTKINDIHIWMFYIVNIKNRIISDFSAKTTSKNIKNSNFGRFLKIFRPFLENFRLKMAYFLTFKSLKVESFKSFKF